MTCGHVSFFKFVLTLTKRQNQGVPQDNRKISTCRQKDRGPATSYARSKRVSPRPKAGRAFYPCGTTGTYRPHLHHWQDSGAKSEELYQDTGFYQPRPKNGSSWVDGRERELPQASQLHFRGGTYLSDGETHHRDVYRCGTSRRRL